MKTTFQDFIIQNQICKKFENAPHAKYIFEKILSKDENIIAMLEVSDSGKPALTACVQEIEKYYKKLTNVSDNDINLNKGFDKQAIGRMIKSILEPFAYVPQCQKDLSRLLPLKYFTSGTVYVFDILATPRLGIKKEIVELGRV